jgi:predicted nuclease of predicted toxin-antitoxin system
LLAEEIERNVFDVFHAQGDADVLIVDTALELAMTNNVVIVGEDTDLLVIALYHIKSTHKVKWLF